MIKGSKVAFVVVCWNSERLLSECLESIHSQTYSQHTTIMVDNGSVDNSVSEAKRIMPSINIIKTGNNNGFAKGNNIGINKAFVDTSVKYVVLLNTDARLDSKWLEKVVSFAETKPKAACLQGTTLIDSDITKIDSTHLYMTRGGQGAQGHWQDTYFEEFGPKKVFGVNAAACLITRRFIEAQPYHELFDESLFMYLEDVDIAARATILGWDNYLVPGARAFHKGSASTGGKTGFSDYGLYMTFRNNMGVILKNYPWSILLKLLVKVPISDYRTVRHLLKLGHKTTAKKVIYGRLVGLVRCPIYLAKRWKLAGKRKIDAKYLWQLMKEGY